MIFEFIRIFKLHLAFPQNLSLFEFGFQSASASLPGLYIESIIACNSKHSQSFCAGWLFAMILSTSYFAEELEVVHHLLLNNS
jgi:hypothetical protein